VSTMLEVTCPCLPTLDLLMVIRLLQGHLALLLLLLAHLSSTLVLEVSQVWAATLSQAVLEHSATRSLLPRRRLPIVLLAVPRMVATSCMLVWSMVESVGAVLL
jgi:hypothetical protein